MELVKKVIAFYQMDNPFELHDNDYWRVRLINVFLILTTVVYAFFIVFNLLVTHLYANAMVDVIGLITVHSILYFYHRHRSVQNTSHYIAVSVFILSAAVIFVSDKNYGILFWSVFLPIFAMFLMGKRLGLYYSITYYSILIVHLLSSMGDKGVTLHTIIEFIVVSAILVAILYYYESSRIQAYQYLEKRTLEDPLTGLYNRRHFDNIYFSEFNRCKRSADFSHKCATPVHAASAISV